MTLALVTAVENALSRVAQEKNNTDGTTTVQLAAGDAAAIKATAEDAQDAPAGEHTDSIIQRFGDVFTKLPKPKSPRRRQPPPSRPKWNRLAKSLF
jgi:hypothetical protein